MSIVALGRRSTGELFGLLFALVVVAAFTYQISGFAHSRTRLIDYRHSRSNDAWFDVAEVSGVVYDTGVIEEREDILFDGVRRFVRSTHGARPDLLFLVLNKDSESWGYEIGQPPRTFNSFLDLINSTDIGLDRVSLGLMTASEEEYDLYRNATADSGIPRVTVLLEKGNEEEDTNLFTHRPRGGRHSFTFQMTRRADIALLRNELMARALHDERHLVWIDSDVKTLTPDMIQTMIAHSETTDDAGVITALCKRGRIQDYDKNAWSGRRAGPPFSGKDPGFTRKAESKPKNVGELILGTTNNDIIHLDSVGGTVLYIRASLIHQGLSFPPYYVIGTQWGEDGFDGLETEGLCYIANYMTGGGCYTLGGDAFVEHTNN